MRALRALGDAEARMISVASWIAAFGSTSTSRSSGNGSRGKVRLTGGRSSVFCYVTSRPGVVNKPSSDIFE
jgi:hypothetical protein